MDRAWDSNTNPNEGQQRDALPGGESFDWLDVPTQKPKIEGGAGGGLRGISRETLQWSDRIHTVGGLGHGFVNRFVDEGFSRRGVDVEAHLESLARGGQPGIDLSAAILNRVGQEVPLGSSRSAMLRRWARLGAMAFGTAAAIVCTTMWWNYGEHVPGAMPTNRSIGAMVAGTKESAQAGVLAIERAPRTLLNVARSMGPRTTSEEFPVTVELTSSVVSPLARLAGFSPTAVWSGGNVDARAQDSRLASVRKLVNERSSALGAIASGGKYTQLRSASFADGFAGGSASDGGAAGSSIEQLLGVSPSSMSVPR